MDKSVLRSNTTRSVATATVVGASTVLGVLGWLRSQGWLPWDEGQDEVVAVFVTTIVVPLLSRQIKQGIDWWKSFPE